MSFVRKSCVALLLACVFCAPSALADDAPKEARQIQVWKKGELTRELDVTDLAPAVTKRLAKQMQADGFVMVESKPPRPADDAVRRDLRELIRRGGRFPEGYQPEAVRPPPPVTAPRPEPKQGGLAKLAGTILKRYLTVKKDPSKASIYEQALEVVADALLAEPLDPGGKGIGLALMPIIVRGLQDERTAPAAVELMETVEQTMGRAPPPPPVKDLGTFGGARLRPGYRLGDVPAGSLAAQMGLQRDDVLQTVGGKRVDPAVLRAARRVMDEGGQLALRVRRKGGETVTLEIEFERE